MENQYMEINFIGERLKRFRVEKNLSQKQLSSITKITIAQISRYENNLATPNGKVLKRLSDTLQIPYSELAGYSKKEELNMEDLNKSIERARLLPKSDLIILKEVIDKFIQSDNIHGLLIGK